MLLCIEYKILNTTVEAKLTPLIEREMEDIREEVGVDLFHLFIVIVLRGKLYNLSV